MIHYPALKVPKATMYTYYYKGHLMVTIKVSEENRKKLNLKKIHNDFRTVDEVITHLLTGGAKC